MIPASRLDCIDHDEDVDGNYNNDSNDNNDSNKSNGDDDDTERRSSGSKFSRAETTRK